MYMYFKEILLTMYNQYKKIYSYEKLSKILKICCDFLVWQRFYKSGYLYCTGKNCNIVIDGDKICSQDLLY